MSAIAFMHGRRAEAEPPAAVDSRDVELVRRVVPALARLRDAAERAREDEAAWSLNEAGRHLRVVLGLEG